MPFTFSAQAAQEYDRQDPLAHYRQEFYIPPHKEGEALYFTGNSLGLQPKKARAMLNRELEDWAALGVEGHTRAKRPWLHYHEHFSAPLAALVGARPQEVVAMNGLTTNLHLLLVSFFRPAGIRNKILCEGKAFPSDQYALKSQLRFHGLDPAEHLIEVQPDPQSELIDDDAIVAAIDAHREELALVMLGGVNYYTGQWFDMARITDAGHRAGAMVGWDLAHAAGNVPLELHAWDVDFAAWCGYKYLNSGPGGISGVYIHQKYHQRTDLPRFEGWWGHDKNDRFAMPENFVPIPTAEAWQLSNAPVLSMTPLLASLELFSAVGLPALRKKSEQLTAYLQFVVEQIADDTGVDLRILTPKEPSRRGCQLSVVIPRQGKKIYEQLSAAGVIADWREPDVIRLAPVPLYNSFSDVYQFGVLLRQFLKNS